MRYLILLHRYLGTAIGMLMVGWCLTGVVMMYVRYPELSQAERLQHLRPVDWRGCCVVSDAALPDDAAVAGFAIESLGSRPVLQVRFTDRSRRLIDLRNGHPISGIPQQQAAAIAAQYAGTTDTTGGSRAGATPRLLGRITYDEWTVSGDFNSARPLYRFALDDPRGTQVYVSARSGRVVQVTTASLRFWNWVGSVPHWLYFAQLRHHVALWAQVVIWTSLAGCFLVLFGIYIGVRHFLRLPAGRWSAYRGLLHWHHLPGLIFGLFALTWVASGLISVNPWGFLDSPGTHSAVDHLIGTPLSGAQVKQSLNAVLAVSASRDILAVDSAPLWGSPYLIVTHTDGSRSRLDPGGRPAPLIDSDWLQIAHTLQGPAATAPELITAGDAYYYSQPGEAAQFPVYRLTLNDEHRTRLYMDPVTGTPLAAVDSDARWYRWLHRGLHTLDFAAPLRARPAWDILSLLLLAGVTAICGTGTWLGWRRYIRLRP